MCDEHAELRAPVAHVVEPQHVVSEELHHAAQRVADDRRPKVALTRHVLHARYRTIKYTTKGKHIY